MFFGFFSFLFWLLKIPTSFFEKSQLQKHKDPITSLLPKIPHSLKSKKSVQIPDKYKTQSLQSLNVVSLNGCIPTPKSLFENHIVFGSITPETALKKCKKRDISSTEEASFKTNTVFEDPGYLVKCKHEHRYLNKKSSGYIYVSIKPVKTYSCLLEETGEWSSAEFVGYTIPIFEKREDQIIGKFYLQKDSIWYDEVIFEEKNDN